MQSEAFRYSAERYIRIGTVVKAQGLRGEVKIQTLSRQPENFVHYPSLAIIAEDGQSPGDFAVDGFRIQADCVIVKLVGVNDRNQAERLVGCPVLLLRSLLPPAGEDEFYWHQLEGLAVSTIDGQRLGTIEALFSNGAQDVIVIRQGQQEYLVPLTKSIIRRQTDHELVIDPPPGLLEINASGENGGLFAE